MKSRNVVGDAVPEADEYNAVSRGLHSLEFSEAALACGMEDRNAGPVWLELELGPVGDHLEVLSAHAADAPTEGAAAVATTDPELVECVARAVVGLPVHGVEGLSFSIVFSVHPRRALDAERGIARAVPLAGEVPRLFDPSSGMSGD